MNEDLENEILLSRFVDGEMSPGEEDAFLAHCEAEPLRYRQVALGLIERDRWSRQCAGMKEACSVMVQDRSVMLPNRNANQLRATRLRGFAMVAASLFLGLMGGYLWNQGAANKQELGDELPLAVTQEEPANRETPVIPESGARRSQEAERIPTTYANHHDNEEAISTLIRAFQPEPLVPAEGVQQLRESGLRVEENTKLYVLELSDGRHLAVPTQFVRFSSQ